MKKLTLCILTFLFLFAFSACSIKAPEEINMHIDSSYTASMGDLQLSGLLIYSEDGEMYLDISTPDELSGLSLSFADDFTMSYRGLSAITESDYLPESSFALSIKNSLDNARLTKPALEKETDKKYTATAKGRSGCYKIYTDEQGNIKELEIIGSDIKLKLKN
mgnify:CR=1 FL=1